MKKTLLPPMGWNSWDCYGAAVNEEQVRKNADFIAKNLKDYGWEYVVVDIQWYEPYAKSHEYREDAELNMDEYGRLLPAPNRFPSAKENGFKALSDYVHSLGLKFGIHILRGIPKQAVRNNTPIKGSKKHASEIADFGSVCEWNGDMCGVDTTRDGSREYYNSIFELYAMWGVDFVKVDDIARPYHKGEVEAVKKAIDICGRDMVLSLSPGESPISEAEHLCEYANMWRMSDDFWDDRRQLRKMFDYCREWFPYVGDGHYPDCDMIPLGNLRLCNGNGGEVSHFSEDESKTLMALWCIFRSPLMFGGDLPTSDESVIKLLKNRELIEMNQHSYANREVMRKGNAIIWAAEGKDSKYLAQFNVGDKTETITTPLSYIGIKGAARAKEMFSGAEVTGDTITSKIPSFGTAVYKITEE